MKKVITIITTLMLGGYAFAQPYIEWANSMGSTNTEQANAVKTDHHGNTYICGNFRGTVDFDPGAGTSNLTSAGQYDIFLAKFNASGTLVWAKNMGGSNTEDGYALALDDSANIYMTGHYWSSNCDLDPSANTDVLPYAGSEDIFVAKYDSSGNYNWGFGYGSVNTDFGRGIAVDVLGNVIVTGVFEISVDFDPSGGTGMEASAGSRDIFLAKYDNGGNYLWSTQIGSGSNDDSYAVDIDQSNSILLTGDINLASVDRCFIRKYSSAGTSIFNHILTTTSGNGYGYAITHDPSNNIYVTGTFSGLVDFNPGAGNADLLATSYNTFVAKYDSAGTYVWSNQTEGTGIDHGRGIAVVNNNLYLGGAFEVTVDMDMGAGTANLTAGGSRDIFMAQYDLAGNYNWAARMGGTGYDYLTGLVVDASEYMYIAGYHGINADFDPGAGTWMLAGAGVVDVCVAKYAANCPTIDVSTIQHTDTLSAVAGGMNYQWIDCNNGNSIIPGATSQTYIASANGSYAVIISTNSGCSDTTSCLVVAGLGIHDASANQWQVYPNPATDFITIQTESQILGQYKICDNQGRVVMVGNLNSSNSVIQVTGLPTGIYFISSDNGYKTVKFIKQ